MSEIVQRFARIALQYPHRPLIYQSGTDEVLTAAAVWHAHLSLRKRLVALGIGPSQLVISAAGNRPAALPLLLACLALRAPLMPVDAGTTVPEIAELAARFRARAVILPNSVTAFPGRSTPLTPDLRMVRRRGGRWNCRGAALLKLTSGSMGMPKATLTAEAHLIADGEQIIEAMGIRAEDTQIASIPLSHSYGFGNLVMPLLLQGTAMVLRDSFVPQQLLSDARRFQSRVLPGVPYIFNYFAANPPRHGWPSHLTLLISAGAPLDPQTAEVFQTRFGTKIHSFYGTSETGGIAYDATDSSNPLTHDGKVGRPMPGATVAILEDENAPSGSGRILVRGPSVAAGYLKAQGERDTLFVEGGFLTGDFGYLDARGELTLTGRASAAINVAGRKFHPGEVERVLRSMNGVEHARVIAVPDTRRGQQTVAFIVSTLTLTALEIRRFCAESLPPYKVPRAVIFLPSFPVTPRGKIDNAMLLELALQQQEERV